MELRELIAQLQKIQGVFGGHIPVYIRSTYE